MMLVNYPFYWLAFLRCGRILLPPCVSTRTQPFIVYCNLQVAYLLSGSESSVGEEKRAGVMLSRS